MYILHKHYIYSGVSRKYQEGVGGWGGVIGVDKQKKVIS